MNHRYDRNGPRPFGMYFWNKAGGFKTDAQILIIKKKKINTKPEISVNKLDSYAKTNISFSYSFIVTSLILQSLANLIHWFPFL